MGVQLGGSLGVGGLLRTAQPDDWTVGFAEERDTNAGCDTTEDWG